MKKIVLITLVCFSLVGYAQKNEKISMIDYVEILNNNKEEALYYYKNNWEMLRIKAIEKGFIDTYQILQTVPTKKTPFSFILITTYTNKEQYAASETNFRKIIEESNGLKLLNDKKPSEFRKVVLHNGNVKHLN